MVYASKLYKLKKKTVFLFDNIALKKANLRTSQDRLKEELWFWDWLYIKLQLLGGKHSLPSLNVLSIHIWFLSSSLLFCDAVFKGWETWTKWDVRFERHIIRVITV